MEEFATRLTLLMLEHGETQLSLAEAIDGDNVSISRYVTRRAVPRLEMLIRIADHYGVSLDYLAGRTDVPEMLR